MGLPWQLIKASTFCCPIFWLRKQPGQEKAISQVAVLIAYTANYNIGKYIDNDLLSVYLFIYLSNYLHCQLQYFKIY